MAIQRLRRLRRTASLRSIVQETHLHKEDLVYPLFVVPGENILEEISALSGQYHYSVDQLLPKIDAIVGMGIKAVLLFGLAQHKDEEASDSHSENGAVQAAIRAVKQKHPDLIVMTDVCMCSFMDHGHCGVLSDNAYGTPDVDNGATLPILQKIAVSHAKAGADVVAPSGMIDGMIGAMREALDAEGYSETIIMSYAVKYASNFYGPFREAADSKPQQGDRKSYQMNMTNVREALLEAEADVNEGADILMVKPALPYLDVLNQVKQQFNQPLAAYQVSGEYACIKAAEEKGWVDGPKTLYESLISIKRAGADLIITYAIEDVLPLIKY